MLRRPSLLLACTAMVLTGACNALTTTNGGGTPVAIMVLNARTKGAGFTTSPTANFYRAQNITFSSAGAATDTCAIGAYSPITPSGNTATVIGAGAYVTFTVSGHTDSLTKGTSADGTYRSSLTSGLTFIPGDSISFNIPGDNAGFPGTTVSAKTAEPFTLDPIIVPPTGQAMTVTWSPATDANAAMLFSFRYSDGTTTGLNSQIFCDFRDDGSGTVQAQNIAKWAASSQREVLVQRLRTQVIQVPITTITAYINVLSTFDIPTPVP